MLCLYFFHSRKALISWNPWTHRRLQSITCFSITSSRSNSSYFRYVFDRNRPYYIPRIINIYCCYVVDTLLDSLCFLTLSIFFCRRNEIPHIRMHGMIRLDGFTDFLGPFSKLGCTLRSATLNTCCLIHRDENFHFSFCEIENLTDGR